MQEPLAVLLSRTGFQECVTEYKKDAAREFGVNLSGEYQTGALVEMEKQGIFRALSLLDGERLVGFISYVLMFLPHRQGVIASTESFFIMPEYRRQHWGKKMVEAAMADAKEQGCKNYLIGLPYGKTRFLDFTPINTVFQHEL